MLNAVFLMIKMGIYANQKLIDSSFKKGDQIWFMRGSRNFRQVGEGGPGPYGI